MEYINRIVTVNVYTKYVTSNSDGGVELLFVVSKYRFDFYDVRMAQETNA
jgi:hypothetical protein